MAHAVTSTPAPVGKQEQRTTTCRAFPSVTPHRGFLPSTDPLSRLANPVFAPLEEAVDLIPKYAVAAGPGELRAWLRSLPTLPAESLGQPAHDGGTAEAIGADSDELWRAYLLLSFLAHAYMWCDAQAGPPASLPANLARPWCAVAQMLDMPPVLVYATYNLYNWRRLDAGGPVELGNLCCLQNFLGGTDEEWFRLIHIAIEAQAAPAVAALPAGQAAASAGDTAGVLRALEAITAALLAMQATLERMGEKCDPYIYYHRVRMPMSGWRNNPALPAGLIYEGQFGGQPQELHGETGAQSSILHAFDAALGIRHDPSSWLAAYLLDMRRHMPPTHRQFIAELEAGTPLRQAAEVAPRSLKDAYNECVHMLEKFRSQHKAFAFKYIARHSQREGETGTGGSDFMPALAGYRNATGRHRLR